MFAYVFEWFVLDAPRGTQTAPIVICIFIRREMDEDRRSAIVLRVDDCVCPYAGRHSPGLQCNYIEMVYDKTG